MDWRCLAVRIKFSRDAKEKEIRALNQLECVAAIENSTNRTVSRHVLIRLFQQTATSRGCRPNLTPSYCELLK